MLKSGKMKHSNAEKLDMLFLHVPKFNNFYDPIGHFILGNLLPMGMFALADVIERAGFRAKIYHLGVEFLLSKNFDLASLIRRRNPQLIGLDLHWHYQTHDVLETARRIKQANPDTAIVLGGYTATIYADAILKAHPAVDFIIRGEAEKPLLQLLQALKDGTNLETVANLTYRKNGGIRQNPITYVATSKDLNTFDFARFDLLDKAPLYFRRTSHIVWLRSFPKRFNFTFFTPGKMGGYIVPVARGCPVDCANCGGGKSPAASIAKRRHVSMRSIKVVAHELEKVRRFGIEDLYFAFDPYPDSSYFVRLFEAIRDRGLIFRAVFETFKLPTQKLIQEFKNTFDRGGKQDLCILISPETGDEAHRRRNRGYFYTNAQLMDTLDLLEAADVPFQISYSLGLPGESPHTLQATRQLWDVVKRRYRKLVTQTATIIDADPLSPMEIDPARYGIACRPRTLAETEILHRTTYKGSHTGWVHLPIHHDCETLPVGAKQSQSLHPTDIFLRQYKCRHFCHYFGKLAVPYPFNRQICKTAGYVFRAHSSLFNLHKIEF
jgi:radical SAM superfamily enzyme YgiQ (UPF0313 family)